MFPSTPTRTSNSTFKGSNGLIEHHPTRPRIPLAERIQRRINRLQGKDENETPSKTKSTERGYLVTPSPSKFGRERMARARTGRSRRLSLENTCLSARGEDALACISVSSVQSSGGLWEHLDCLSASGGAGRVNLNSSGTSSSRINVKAERTPVEDNAPNIQTPASTTMSHSPDASVKNPLHEYFTLKFEAETALLESKKQWVDTPYSVSAVQGKQAEIVMGLVFHALSFGRFRTSLRCEDDTIRSSRVFE